MKRVAALFCEKNSIYHSLLGVEVWDKERDAMHFAGGMPVVAHPPCRLWGKLSHLSTAPESEKELARFSVRVVRECGGVLEHPQGSRLWDETPLPKPGKGCDQWGGYTIGIDQFWFGHVAQKRSLLYICGVRWQDLPPIPFEMGEPRFVVSSSKKKYKPNKPEMPKSKRTYTPKLLAEWLVETARRTSI